MMEKYFHWRRMAYPLVDRTGECIGVKIDVRLRVPYIWKDHFNSLGDHGGDQGRETDDEDFGKTAAADRTADAK